MSASLPKTQKRWVLPEEGAGIDGLKLDREAAVPTLTGDDILIRVKAVSLNYRDYVIAKGGAGVAPLKNFSPLSDAAGDVVACGPCVSGPTAPKVGDRVVLNCAPGEMNGHPRDGAGLNPMYGGGLDGVAAEYVRVPANSVVKIPSWMSYAEGSSLACAGITAWKALNSGPERLCPGATVLVQGTGGVSVLAAQFATAAGCRVIATSSSNEKLAEMVKLGLVAQEDCINYRENPNWGAAALARTMDGRGVDVIVDVGGASSLNESLSCVRRYGVVASVGILDSVPPAGGFAYGQLLFREAYMKGVLLGTRNDLDQLVTLCTVKTIHPVLDKTPFTLEQLPDAYRHLASQKHMGKVTVSFE